MNQEVKQWIEMAEMDYGVAKHLYETYYPKPLEISVITVSRRQKRR